MSLVSDAHRRANGEAIDEGSKEGFSTLSRWLLILLFAMAIASAATAWFLRSVKVASNVVLEQEQQQEHVSARDQADIAEEPEDLAASAFAEKQATEPSAAVAALYERAQAERDSIEQESNKKRIPTNQGTVAKESTQSNEFVSATPVDTRPNSNPIDEAQLLARAQSLLASSQRDEALHSALPSLDTLDEEARNSVPTLLYSAHDYRTDGGSKVMINREWWSEGEQVSGIKVIEIREKSTVFETQNGTRFLQPALSSWVNL